MWARNNYFLRQLKLGAFCVTATSITLTDIPTKTVWHGRRRKELPWKYKGAIARRKKTNAGQARTIVIYYSSHCKDPLDTLSVYPFMNHLLQAVVGWIIAPSPCPQGVHILIPETYEHVTLHDKGELRLQMELRLLTVKSGRCPGLSRRFIIINVLRSGRGRQKSRWEGPPLPFLALRIEGKDHKARNVDGL